MAAASLLLQSAGRLLLRPIPRAAHEVSLPRRLYSSQATGTSKPQTDMLLQRAQQDLTLEYKALEERMISRVGNLDRGLDALEDTTNGH
uniref:Uncharacterized protein n=1 Tax=Leersia perrieri TaxID=77586 RepID=A0A0D9XC26_9ORYZ